VFCLLYESAAPPIELRRHEYPRQESNRLTHLPCQKRSYVNLCKLALHNPVQSTLMPCLQCSYRSPPTNESESFPLSVLKTKRGSKRFAGIGADGNALARCPAVRHPPGRVVVRASRRGGPQMNEPVSSRASTSERIPLKWSGLVVSGFGRNARRGVLFRLINSAACSLE
jgi:hypothetical protein